MLVKIANLLRRARSERGFTLIELVIVIGIIGVLAGIAVPRYSAYKTTAENNADRLTARVVQTAIELYYALEGHYPLDEAGEQEPISGNDALSEADGLYDKLIAEDCLREAPEFNTLTPLYDPDDGSFTVS